MKNKKIVFPLAAVILVLVLVLVACGAKSSSTTRTSNSGSTAPNGTPGAAYLTQPLPLAESLVIGTFKLEGTTNAITPTQATTLVSLWQAYAQLTSSNTAAQAEIDAVVSQIQSTMTPTQVQAITAMKLTRQDLTKTETSLGLTNGGYSGTGTPGFRLTPGAGRGGGGGFFPGGGGGGGGGFPGDGGGGVPGAGGTTGTRPTPNATALALRAQFANRIPTALMNALVTYLQKTAGS